MNTIDKTIHALDASRRAGWAKYFTAEERVEQLEGYIHELVELLVFHDRLSNTDPALVRACAIRKEIQ